jgi:hypothetical protein
MVVSAIMGGAISVAADRMWRRVETKPKFAIRVSSFKNLQRREDGFTVHVTNGGRHEIPPYSVEIFHPLRGATDCFPAEDEDSPLLPDQTRKHQNTLRRNGTPDDWLVTWMLRENSQPVDEPKVDDFKLRIVLSKSEKVLFESSTIGRAYATQMLQAIGRGQHLTTRWQDLRTPTPLFRRIWDPIRRRIGFKTEVERFEEKFRKQKNSDASTQA